MMMCSVVLFLPLLSHSHWFSRGAAYVRTDIDVITEPKISGIDGLLYFLTHGARGGARSSTMISEMSSFTSRMKCVAIKSVCYVVACLTVVDRIEKNQMGFYFTLFSR